MEHLSVPADGVTDTIRLQLALRLLGFGFDRIRLETGTTYIVTETLHCDNPLMLTHSAEADTK